MKKILIIMVVFTTFSISALEQYIGLTPVELIEAFGAPEQVLTIRGESEKEDDVLFFYNSRIYVYINGNRVWQLRVDKQYKESVFGIRIGDTTETVIEELGEPDSVHADSLVYRQPYAGYPVYLRIFYNDNKIDDIYLFRGDY